MTGSAAWCRCRCFNTLSSFNFWARTSWTCATSHFLLLRSEVLKFAIPSLVRQQRGPAFPISSYWRRPIYDNPGSLSKLFLWLKTLVAEDIMGFFYAVARGRKPGVYMTWSECNSQVSGFPNARYKKFPSQKEAEEFIEEHTEVGKGSTAVKTTGDSKRKVEVDHSSPSSLANAGKSPLVLYSKTSSQARSINSLAMSSQKKTLVCEPQPLPSCASSRSISTSGSLGKRGASNEAKDNKEFVTGKLSKSKRPKLCEEVDLSSFEIDEDGYVVVYTDGACKNNGKGKACAGIGVWFGESHFLNISERVTTRQTNNSAEIQASERAIRAAKKFGISKLSLKTDSQFVLNCVGKWMAGWKRNNWMKGGRSGSQQVINKDDLMVLDETMKGIEIKWSYIQAHKGHVGNEGADRLAVQGSLLPLRS